MEYESLEDYRIPMRRAIERLETDKLLRCDENRALKAEARSYQEELARMRVSHQHELARVRVSYEDELVRTRTCYDDKLAQMRVEIENLERRQELLCDEVRALNAAARSYQDELAEMDKEIDKIEAERLRQHETTCALEVKARSHIDELAKMDEEIKRVEAERLRQHETTRALEVKASFHHDELVQMRKEIEKLEEDRRVKEEEIRALNVGAWQETPAKDIGREVRLRYLEKHRLRMGRRIGQVGHQRIKCGDRAAHRGRPVVDALLCLTGEITDRAVYPDLYGVRPEIMKQWMDVREIVDITGFRASLQSEGRLTAEFLTPFERLLEIATAHLSPTELIAAFGNNKVLQQLHLQLQNCYDKIVAENRYCKKSTGSDPHA